MIDKHKMIRDIKEKIGDDCLFAYTEEYIMCPHIIPLLLDKVCPGDLWPEEYPLCDEQDAEGCQGHWTHVLTEAGLLVGKGCGK